MKKNTIMRTMMTIIITSIITFTVTYLWLYGSKGRTIASESLIGNALATDTLTSKLKIIKDKINEVYLGDIDENNLKEYTIKGYVAGLKDKYSGYLTSDEMSEYTTDTLGEYVGIGVYITKDETNNQILIYSTIKDSSAEKAGLLAGDVITEVDGTKCNGDDYETITNRIKGKEGTKVNIKILRNKEEKTFEIERKKVTQIRVNSQMLENNIGYIYISSFDGNIAKQFKEQYDELENNGATSLIVDVRNNGGGMIDEATGIGDLFTDKDSVLLIEKDKNGKETTTKAKSDKKITMKTVLLVNKDSASASEILAGIFQDSIENSKIIGTKTYGKGVIQTVFQLSDGSGLKLTTNEYFTPKHNKINKIGVTPDIVVDDYQYTGILETEKDTQLKKAIEELKK